jgi:hypothetical protein
MAKKKKKKALCRRSKRMKRPGRLQSAKNWLGKYNGKNIQKGYMKHFGVDRLCAFIELKMLGIEFPPGYEEHIRQLDEANKKSKATRKQKKKDALKTEEEKWSLIESDDWYAYIAGYTEGGVPFGITWEQWEKIAEMESWETLGKIAEMDEMERMECEKEIAELFTYAYTGELTGMEPPKNEEDKWQGLEEMLQIEEEPEEEDFMPIEEG